jgi:ribosomal protein S12 methylthiotransferase
LKKVGVVSLGCCKNRVDTEVMLAQLKSAGYELTPYEEQADVLVVNTCGFIDAAKREAIDTILDMARYKTQGDLKKLVVTGCLSQRYAQTLYEEMPEIDLILGTGQYRRIGEYLQKRERFVKVDEPDTDYDYGARVLTTPPHYAYLRVADGCDNKCSYCAIPSIRGAYASRTMEDVLSEAQALAGRGVAELNVVAQDTTRYGMDRYQKPMLPELLTRLCRIDGVRWVRLLYLYPDLITEELLDVMEQEEKVCKYVEMPIQHAHDAVLARMNRRGDSALIAKLMRDIRARSGAFIIRTSLITGFPGEVEQEHEALLRFIQENEFDRLGVFEYSQEEGTKAASMKQVEPDVRRARYAELMDAQKEISHRRNGLRVGKTYEALIEGAAQDGAYLARSYGEAPEIDPHICVITDTKLAPGDFVRVRITQAGDYDLTGELAT